MKLSDTTPEIQAEYDRRWQLLTPSDRFQRGLALIRLSRDMMVAGFKARHPELTPPQLKQNLRKFLYNR